jgi:hypothetical protein
LLPHLNAEAAMAKPKVPLKCRRCVKAGRPGSDLEIGRNRQELKVDGKETVHAPVTCRDQRCKHKWWSRHDDAIRLSREADKRAMSSIPLGTV